MTFSWLRSQWQIGGKIMENNGQLKNLTRVISEVQKNKKEIRITNTESYVQLAHLLMNVKSAIAAIKSYWDPVCNKMNAAHKEATTQRARMMRPILILEEEIKTEISHWITSEKETRRQDEMTAALAEKKRREDQLLIEAETFEKMGRHQDASRTINIDISVPMIPLPTGIPKISGISETIMWRFKITDPEAVPREYCIPDESKIRKIVSALGEKANIPGIEIYSETVIRSREMK